MGYETYEEYQAAVEEGHAAEMEAAAGAAAGAEAQAEQEFEDYEASVKKRIDEAVRQAKRDTIERIEQNFRFAYCVQASNDDWDAFKKELLEGLK